MKFCVDCGLNVLIVPGIDEVVDGRLMKQNIRQIKIEDLLGRDEVKINLKEIRNTDA